MLKKFSNFSNEKNISEENVYQPNDKLDTSNPPRDIKNLINLGYQPKTDNTLTTPPDSGSGLWSPKPKYHFTKKDLEDAYEAGSDSIYHTEDDGYLSNLSFDNWFNDKYSTSESIIESVESLNESFQPQEDNIHTIKNELETKYSTNEAIESVSVEEDDDGKYIQFNIKCETDIEGTTMEYNGYRLKYNHICEIKKVDEDEEFIDESILENQKNLMFGFIKKTKNNE